MKTESGSFIEIKCWWFWRKLQILPSPISELWRNHFLLNLFILIPSVVQHLKWGQSRGNWVNREYLKLEAVHFVWNQSFPFSKTPVALFIFSYLKTSNWKLFHYWHCRKNHKKLALQISYIEKVFPNLLQILCGIFSKLRWPNETFLI